MSSFQELINLVVKMDANPITWKSRKTIQKIQFDFSMPVEVQISDVVTHSETKLLTCKGKQVLLYIKDTNNPKNIVLFEPKKTKKVHFMECTMILKMRASGRGERYVVTDRKDGYFFVNTQEERWDCSTIEENVEARLHVCKYCLSEYNYKEYSSKSWQEKNELASHFDFEEFFEIHLPFFRSLPKYTDKTVPINQYDKNWEVLSKKIRESHRWICKKCNVNLSNHKSLLHVHHINGIKSDNSPSNLKVLCVECHSQQPNHEHMVVKFSEKSKLKELRGK